MATKQSTSAQKEKLSYHVAAFSEKVRVMNQTGGKRLSLSSEEAQSLQADIFSLLAKIAELSSNSTTPEVIEVKMDGGRF